MARSSAPGAAIEMRGDDDLPWLELMLFMLAIGFFALYGLTFSGHFPVEFRAASLKTVSGAIILWMTLATACSAANLALVVALPVLPWSASIIGSGVMMLATPLLLRPFPDHFVNSPAALVVFAAGTLFAAVGLWASKLI